MLSTRSLTQTEFDKFLQVIQLPTEMAIIRDFRTKFFAYIKHLLNPPSLTVATLSNRQIVLRDHWKNIVSLQLLDTQLDQEVQQIIALDFKDKCTQLNIFLTLADSFELLEGFELSINSDATTAALDAKLLVPGQWHGKQANVTLPEVAELTTGLEFYHNKNWLAARAEFTTGINKLKLIPSLGTHYQPALANLQKHLVLTHLMLAEEYHSQGIVDQAQLTACDYLILLAEIGSDNFTAEEINQDINFQEKVSIIYDNYLTNIDLSSRLHELSNKNLEFSIRNILILSQVLTRISLLHTTIDLQTSHAKIKQLFSTYLKDFLQRAKDLTTFYQSYHKIRAFINNEDLNHCSRSIFILTLLEYALVNYQLNNEKNTKIILRHIVPHLITPVLSQPKELLDYATILLRHFGNHENPSPCDQACINIAKRLGARIFFDSSKSLAYNITDFHEKIRLLLMATKLYKDIPAADFSTYDIQAQQNTQLDLQNSIACMIGNIRNCILEFRKRLDHSMTFFNSREQIEDPQELIIILGATKNLTIISANYQLKDLLAMQSQLDNISESVPQGLVNHRELRDIQVYVENLIYIECGEPVKEIIYTADIAPVAPITAQLDSPRP